jgi:hypothetical protein
MNFLHFSQYQIVRPVLAFHVPQTGGMLADWSSDAKVLECVITLFGNQEWSHHTLAMAQAAGTKCCVPGLRKRP